MHTHRGLITLLTLSVGILFAGCPKSDPQPHSFILRLNQNGLSCTVNIPAKAVSLLLENVALDSNSTQLQSASIAGDLTFIRLDSHPLTIDIRGALAGPKGSTGTLNVLLDEQTIFSISPTQVTDDPTPVWTHRATVNKTTFEKAVHKVLKVQLITPSQNLPEPARIYLDSIDLYWGTPPTPQKT